MVHKPLQQNRIPISDIQKVCCLFLKCINCISKDIGSAVSYKNIQKQYTASLLSAFFYHLNLLLTPILFFSFISCIPSFHEFNSRILYLICFQPSLFSKTLLSIKVQNNKYYCSHCPYHLNRSRTRNKLKEELHCVKIYY